MKTIWICTWLLAVGITAGAQELKVRVQTDSEPLAYAYVYVNGRAAAVTDTLGIATVPDGKWHEGDTLSASYVGTAPDSLVVDRRIVSRGTCELVLSEMYILTADEVKVKANIEKLFRKTVRACRPFYYQAHLHANFNAKITSADGRSFPVNGKFVARNNISDYLWFTEIDTQSDTSDRMVAQILRGDMLEVLCTAKTALAVLVYPAYRDKAVYGYLGKKTGIGYFGLVIRTLRRG